jgi:two-component system, NtrC family, response regulator AtoC
MKSLAGTEILLLEDEVLLRKRLTAFLERQGAEVSAAGTLAQAGHLLKEVSCDFALIDVNLPDGDGLELLRNKRFSENTAVVVMTADGSVSVAVEAMKLGAADYLVKPFEADELPLVFQRVRRNLQTARIEAHRRGQESAEGNAFFFGEDLGEVRGLLGKIIAADQRLQGALPPVLIEGETGTGKTSIARWIHYHGPRSQAPLVEVNCSALPEALAESELFGHERGAFTDARKERIGLFEAADGGTLFLDEITSLPLTLQAKVLTAVEDGRIRRLGGNRTLGVDVRLVVAANCPLQEKVQSGEFREDLFHRLDLFRVCIPPLRQRARDLLPLAEQLLRSIENRHRVGSRPFSRVAKERLSAYAWPGNVRELMHVLERAVVFEEGEELHLEGIPAGGGGAVGHSPQWLPESFIFPPTGFSVEEEINRMIRLALRQCDDNVSAAARLLGVSRDFVRYRLQQNRGEVLPEASGRPGFGE